MRQVRQMRQMKQMKKQNLLFRWVLFFGTLFPITTFAIPTPSKTELKQKAIPTPSKTELKQKITTQKKKPQQKKVQSKKISKKVICQCFANGQQNESFCEGHGWGINRCLDPKNNDRCHWGPTEIAQCATQTTNK